LQRPAAEDHDGFAGAVAGSECRREFVERRGRERALRHASPERERGGFEVAR
jgi:hypothetical protein